MPASSISGSRRSTASAPMPRRCSITRLGIPFWIAFAGAVALAGAAGIVLSLFAMRLRGHYLAIASLGFAVITYQVLLNWISLTQGPLGIYAIPPPPALTLPGVGTIDFHDLGNLFYLVAAFALLSYLLLDQLIRSPIGETLTAIREDEVSAASLGINCGAWKVFAFGVGAAIAGAAGSFYAGFVGTLVPDAFFVTEILHHPRHGHRRRNGDADRPGVRRRPADDPAGIPARHRRPAARRLRRRGDPGGAVPSGRDRRGGAARTRTARAARPGGSADERGNRLGIGRADRRRASRGRTSEQELRRRPCGARYFAHHSHRRDPRRHRAERRRQIDAAQSAQRRLPARLPARSPSRGPISRTCAPIGASATGSPARSRKSGCSGISRRSRTSSPDFICVTTSRPGNISCMAPRSGATATAAATRRCTCSPSWGSPSARR